MIESRFEVKIEICEITPSEKVFTIKSNSEVCDLKNIKSVFEKAGLETVEFILKLSNIEKEKHE